MTTLNTERAWQKVDGHDASSDGKFVYAVRSTGIYCRPSCPSRRPAQDNVIFFDTGEQARAAGYRACKRCRPDGIHPQAAIVARACRAIDNSCEKAPSLAGLGKAVGMSPYALQRVFRQILGVTPRQYFATRRAHRFRQELARSGTVTSAMYEAGYESSSRAYERSAGNPGMTPGMYRNQGAGQKIRYTLAWSPLGRILVAVTERGICAVSFGDTDVELCAILRRDFALADLERDDEALASRLSAVLARLQEHPISTVLPLDVRATAFQRRVWEALQQIPCGETRSYSEIAAAIGQPTAVRAVARACAQNPVAVVVPCHRVIGKNGEVTGYRWGIERKENLLALEAKSELHRTAQK